ncbi:MAG: RluA family pseudouridine synthase, partial [Thermotaleaceae bacterium]
MREILIEKNEENQRVDKFLKKYFPKATLGWIYKMLRKKNIKVNEQKVDPKYILLAGDKIQIYFSEDTITNLREIKVIHNINIQFQVVYEDNNILIVNKPKGVLVDTKENVDTLTNQAIKYLYEKGAYDPLQEKTFVPASVNRIDRNTTGMVLIAKNNETVQNLNEMMRQRKAIRKYYKAIVKGNVKKEEILTGFLIKEEKKNQVRAVEADVTGAKEIHTRIRPIKNREDFSLLEIEILTGRSHQIRFHLSEIGHPILGDTKYGDREVNQRLKRNFKLDSQLL